MITVSGTATLRVDFSVEVKMTEDQWDALGESKQNELLDSAIDWYDAYKGAEVDEFEVDDLVEIEGGIKNVD